MPQTIEGQLDLTMGTGRNTFVLNPINTTYASVIVDPEEAKKLTQEDIGKRYIFCQKIIKIGISEFVVAYDLKEISLQQWKNKFTHNCAIKAKNK